MTLKRKNLTIVKILLTFILIVVTPLTSFGDEENNSKSIDIEIAKVGDDDFSSLCFDYWKVDGISEKDYMDLAEKYEKMGKEELDKLFGPSKKTKKTSLEDKKSSLKVDGLDSSLYLFKLDDESFSLLKNFYVPAFFVDTRESDKFILENKVKDLGLSLEKVDKDKHDKKLQNVSFDLYEYKDKKEDAKKVSVTKKDGIYYIDSSGKDSLVTDKDGKIKVYGLSRDKNYYFKEVKTLPDYILNETATQNLRYGDSVIVENQTKVEKGKYKFVKVDSKNQKTHLKGARFAVAKFDEKDKTYKVVKDGDSDYILTSDNKGEFVTKDLEYGNYRLEEVTAPSGYQLSNNPIDFKIDGSLKSLKVMGVTFIKNTKIPPNTPPKTNRPPIVKTGDIQILIFLALGLIFILIGVRLFRKEETIS